MKVSLTQSDVYSVEIYPRNSEGLDGCWTWGVEKATENVDLLVANHASTGKWSVFRKDYLEGDSLFTKSKALWLESEMNHENGKEMIGKLFGSAPFSFPKSVEYIKKCVQLGTKKDSIVMDFFSGSATTAHAVMKLNQEDGGTRRFILVQLNEPFDPSSDEYAQGYSNICMVGEERIRRAGKLLTTNQQKTLDNEQGNLDCGMRVLKIDSTNMKGIYYNPQALRKDILDYAATNIKSDRSGEDLLFQVMLDLGIELSASISERIIVGKHVYVVDEGYLIACFDENITDDVVTEIAKQKPTHVVFRDSSMANDSVAINFEQIFKAYSPNTKTRVL